MNEQIELDDVLDAYLAAGGDASSLNTLIRRFPQFEAELTEFAATRALMHSMPPPDGSPPSDDELVARGMGIVQQLLGAPAAAKSSLPIRSLVEEAKALGLSLQQLRDSVGLGRVVLMKLDRRVIRFGSIPRAAIEQLAAAIQRDFTSVANYLQQAPTLAASASFRSEQAPEVGAQEDFATAVRADATMSAEQRARWLDQ
jgi:hypothetical protein